jgi:hypothetical protein
MTSPSFFDYLFEQGLLSKESFDKIREKQSDKTISLFWDLRLVLYAGVLLLTGGLGVLIYKNIDDIGHLAIIAAMALTSLFCYGFALKRMNPFSWNEVKSPGVVFDYVLLLGSILMVTLVGYVQYQYKIFGTEWKLATFIPMMVLFLTAYFFDHQGLLSMAIVNLAAWLGITINEKVFTHTNQLNDKETLVTAALLGAALILASWLSRISRKKAHFSQLYHQFGTHLYFISSFVALFVFSPNYYPWVLVYLAGSVYHYIKSVKEKSYYYMVITMIYTYGCISFMVVDMIDKSSGQHYDLKGKLTFAYFTFSSIAMIFLLIRQNKIFRKHAGLQ